MKKTLLRAAGAGSLLALLPLAAHAADDFTTTSTTDTANAAAVGTAGAGFAVFFIIIWLIMLAVGIFLFVFWILMLIDVFKRTNWEQENDRVLWIILVIILGYLGAIIYYFVIKRKLDSKATVSNTPPTQTPPAAQ